MAAQVPTPSPATARIVQLANTPSIAQTLPTISVGDIVRFSVKQNTGQGSGLIFINGKLLEASIPKNLQSGSRLLARVATLDSQILFKILDSKSPLSMTPGGPSNTLNASLLNIVKGMGPGGVKGLGPFQLPNALSQLGLSQHNLQQLLSSLGNLNTLLDPKETLSLLLSAANGTLANDLKQSADMLKGLAKGYNPDSLDRLFLALKPELSRLINLSSENNTKAASQLEILIKNFSKHVNLNTKENGSSENILQSTLVDLKSAQAQPAKLRSMLEMLHTKIDDFLNANSKGLGKSSLANLTALQQAAVRLEQMANTQEVLRQLNPIMQSMGEPALILFPFLFQGLVSHTQITIDPNAKNNQQKKNSKDSGKDKEDSSGNETAVFQRIQVNVPLPRFGNIGVDIAHRHNEILVRFLVEDQEKARFLLEQLEHLNALLRSQGYERAELVATVGGSSSTSPAWSNNLRVEASAVA